MLLDGCHKPNCIWEISLSFTMVNNGMTSIFVSLSVCYKGSILPWGGLKCTSYLQKRKLNCSKNVAQIVHTRGDHWMILLTVNRDSGEVRIYDSVYSKINEETKILVNKLFKGKFSRLTNGCSAKRNRVVQIVVCSALLS